MDGKSSIGSEKERIKDVDLVLSGKSRLDLLEKRLIRPAIFMLLGGSD